MQLAEAIEADQPAQLGDKLLSWSDKVDVLSQYIYARESTDEVRVKRICSTKLFVPLLSAAAGLSRPLLRLNLDMKPLVIPRLVDLQLDSFIVCAHEIKLTTQGQSLCRENGKKDIYLTENQAIQASALCHSCKNLCIACRAVHSSIAGRSRKGHIHA